MSPLRRTRNLAPPQDGRSGKTHCKARSARRDAFERKGHATMGISAIARGAMAETVPLVGASFGSRIRRAGSRSPLLAVSNQRTESLGMVSSGPRQPSEVKQMHRISATSVRTAIESPTAECRPRSGSVQLLLKHLANRHNPDRNVFEREDGDLFVLGQDVFRRALRVIHKRRGLARDE